MDRSAGAAARNLTSRALGTSRVRVRGRQRLFTELLANNREERTDGVANRLQAILERSLLLRTWLPGQEPT